MRLIDADAAIDAVERNACNTQRIMDAIKALPTIEQPTPTEWIKMSDADGYYYCCNNCGEELPRYQLDTPTFDKPFPPKMSIERTRFCPNCGARMVME